LLELPENDACPTVTDARQSLSFPLGKNDYYRVPRGQPARELLTMARD
jgi:hypothetical protein